LSIDDWHNAGATGSNVTIAVIDTGFVTGGSSSERACSPQPSLIWPNNNAGSGNGGLQTIEVLCDLAPDADVYKYRASNLTEVVSAINAALTAVIARFPCRPMSSSSVGAPTRARLPA
ncbi:MAG: hypothetical protein LRY51_16035, partial [Geovibrio sp.]|nr:hypothetical protein [Geovibrio sp.]